MLSPVSRRRVLLGALGRAQRVATALPSPRTRLARGLAPPSPAAGVPESQFARLAAAPPPPRYIRHRTSAHPLKLGRQSRCCQTKDVTCTHLRQRLRRSRWYLSRLSACWSRAFVSASRCAAARRCSGAVQNAAEVDQQEAKMERFPALPRFQPMLCLMRLRADRSSAIGESCSHHLGQNAATD